jgi:hypothetical protein
MKRIPRKVKKTLRAFQGHGPHPLMRNRRLLRRLARLIKRNHWTFEDVYFA